jgi:hypothetical protein
MAVPMFLYGSDTKFRSASKIQASSQFLRHVKGFYRVEEINKGIYKRA